MVRKKKEQKKKIHKKLLIRGIIHVHHRGFGFVRSDKETKTEIFIPKPYTQGAIDNDWVEVEVEPIVSEKGPEGKVLRILKRGRSEVVGTILAKQENLNEIVYKAFIPSMGSAPPMKVTSEKEEYSVGDRIVIHVLDWGKKERESKGKILELIGSIKDPFYDVKTAIKEYCLEESFPEDVLAEARSFGRKVKPSHIQSREDLRNLECFTIDPETAKDYDDALSLSIDDEGHYHLGVHIADVTAYVSPGSALDREAKKRCNSTYFPGMVIPMLPHELSSHLCSLMPQVNRLAVSVLIIFDQEGTLSNYRITRSVIKSRKRFTYGDAKAILDGKKKSPYAKNLFMMVDLCRRLKKKRAERGSIEFAVPDVSLRVDDSGAPIDIAIVEYDVTHQLVEEFMLKANELVATFLAEQRKPLTYRIHEEPHLENMQQFAARCRTFGFPLSPEPSSEELQKMFDQVRETPFGQFIATSFIRSMKLATYSVQNVGHYGLGLKYYTHFTSPIRRYIDLIVHRVLFNDLTDQDHLEEIAQECSEKERLSSRAENTVIILKKLRLIRALIKKEPKRSFGATIVEIKPFGIVFEATEFLMDGFLHLSDLREDYYIYDEKKGILKGDRTGRNIASGDKIKIRPKHIDLITKEIQWELVNK